ncbi:hypothetical protein SKAU_G00355080 [Synaphobranchus kaupii]|uniref:Uncharacterized protein n=1 Tax=Synaphobranchus kaupii TaxID=118154 RepID=A0A9Q1EH91_SYNKA|nr:hypothetical protein SKAU_G00355080 [Synaphobranchus kaupii]
MAVIKRVSGANVLWQLQACAPPVSEVFRERVAWSVARLRDSPMMPAAADRRQARQVAVAVVLCGSRVGVTYKADRNPSLLKKPRKIQSFPSAVPDAARSAVSLTLAWSEWHYITHHISVAFRTPSLLWKSSANANHHLEMRCFAEHRSVYLQCATAPPPLLPDGTAQRTLTELPPPQAPAPQLSLTSDPSSPPPKPLRPNPPHPQGSRPLSSASVIASNKNCGMDSTPPWTAL